VTGKTIKFGRTPMTVGPAPVVGEHTEEILTGVLGYSGDRVRALQDEDVVYCAEPAPVPEAGD
jgi:crotonobetainyl-CoA:carnitine CoA-transferase CaiB-like acyl-CoA transferase